MTLLADCTFYVFHMEVRITFKQQYFNADKRVEKSLASKKSGNGLYELLGGLQFCPCEKQRKQTKPFEEK